MKTKSVSVLLGAESITHIKDRDGKLLGAVTGGTKPCSMESCRGLRIGVRWPDGKLTWPCSKGLVSTRKRGVWRIG